MSAIANIVLADGQATPVNHTFAPVNINQVGTAKWADRSGGIAIGYPVVTLNVREPQKGSPLFKVSMKVVVPTLEVTAPSTATGIQPAPTKAYDCLFACDWILPERSTQQERKNLLAYVKNLFAAGVVTSAIQDLESVY